MNCEETVRRTLRLAAVLIFGAWLGACASTPATIVLLALPPAAPLDRPAAAPTDVAAAPAVKPGVLLVRRLGIPEYMAARRVRYWSDTTTIAEWPDTFWAERIEVGMAREFVAALRAELPGWTLCDASCGDTLPDVTLNVSVLRLDFRRPERHLSAQAEVRAAVAKISAQPASQTTRSMPSWRLPVANDSAQGQAQAMSMLLQRLAAAAADVVRRETSGSATTR